VVSAVSEVPRGWSFLVARGLRKGYRTLLAPDFLVRGGAQDLLSRASSGDSLDPGGMRTVEIDDPRGEPLTVCFRTEQVAPADVGAARDGDRPVAVDQHGRPLEMLYGVVASGRLDRPPPAEHLDRARVEALRSYRRFLADEVDFRVDSSRAVALRGARVRREAPYPAPRPTAPDDSPPHQARDPRGAGRRAAPPRASRPRRASGLVWARLTSIAVVAAIGSAAFSLLQPDTRHATKISVDQITVGPARPAVRCDAEAPLLLEAKVHAERPTRVTYRWKFGEATIAKGSVHVGVRRTRIARAHGLPRSGVVELVVGRTRRVQPYDVACPPPLPAPPSPPASASSGRPPSAAPPVGPAASLPGGAPAPTAPGGEVKGGTMESVESPRLGAGS